MSAWINHVKKFAKDNNMTYPQALKDQKCSAAYVKAEPPKKTPIEKPKEESPKTETKLLEYSKTPVPTPKVKVTKKPLEEVVLEDIQEEKPVKKVTKRVAKKPVEVEEELEEETITEPVKKTRVPKRAIKKMQQTEAVAMIDESLHKPKRTKKVL